MIGKLEIAAGETELAAAAAEHFIDWAKGAFQKQERFSVALSGGRGPQGMFQELKKRSGELDWSRIELYWVDERWAAFDDGQSNCGNTRRLLLDALKPGPEQFPMYMPGISPEAAAAQYEALLIKRFGEQGPFFDLCLLGMGPDGHTASLFPGQASLEEKQRLCFSVRHYQTGQERLTLSFPVINRSRRLVVLLSGAEKAKTLAEILEGHSSLPAARILPEFGELLWMSSADATSLLPKELRA